MFVASLLLSAVAAPHSLPLAAERAEEHQIAPSGSEAYTVFLENGSRLMATFDQHGAGIAIHVLAPDGSELSSIDSPNGAKGPELVDFVAPVTGTFRLVVNAAGGKAPVGDYAVTSVKIHSAAEEQSHEQVVEAQHAVVRHWLAKRSVKLGDTAASVAAALGPALRGVQILGLGEGSHGSHEIFDLKARIVRALVRYKGFRVLAMELDRVACEQLDSYVHGSTEVIDPRLKPWDTEEFIGLLKWLRHWNSRAIPADRVSVIGIDGQDRKSGADSLIAYLRRAAPDEADTVAKLTSNTVFPLKLPSSERLALQRGYIDLLGYFELHATSLILQSSKAEYRSMRDLVQVMAQTGSIFRDDMGTSSDVTRNEYMADNLRRYLDEAGKPMKVIIWAHNAHVETSPGPVRPTGFYLRKLYGARYYALNSTFADGEYQAWTSGSPTFELGVFQAAALPAMSIEDDFKAVGPGPFIVNLRGGSPPPEVARWLNEPHPARLIGAMHSATSDQYTIEQIVPGKSVDGYLFVLRSTRAIPTARMRAKYGEAPSSIAKDR